MKDGNYKMAETSWPWGGLYIGDAKTGHRDSDFALAMMSSLSGKRTTAGVLGHYSSITLTVNPPPPANEVQIGAGYAMVDGVLYYNSAIISATVYGTGYHWVVIRKSVATQQVRYGVLGAGDSLSFPSPNTTGEAIKEIPLGYVHVDSDGVI